MHERRWSITLFPNVLVYPERFTVIDSYAQEQIRKLTYRIDVLEKAVKELLEAALKHANQT